MKYIFYGIGIGLVTYAVGVSQPVGSSFRETLIAIGVAIGLTPIILYVLGVRSKTFD